jgi:hypothetical protein
MKKGIIFCYLSSTLLVLSLIFSTNFDLSAASPNATENNSGNCNLNEVGTNIGAIPSNSKVISGSVKSNSDFIISLDDKLGNPYANLKYNSITQTYSLIWLPVAPQQKTNENPLPQSKRNLSEKDKLLIAHYINDYKGSSNKFQVFPNPATKTISLDLNNYIGKNIKLIVSNIEGKEIINKEIENLGENLLNLNLETYPKGVYFISIFNGSNTVTKKIIVE